LHFFPLGRIIGGNRAHFREIGTVLAVGEFSHKSNFLQLMMLAFLSSRLFFRILSILSAINFGKGKVCLAGRGTSDQKTETLGR
jgi:hypothetical protein